MITELIITSVMLGAGLAMDAFSVSLANGFAEPDMNILRTTVIAGTYAGFQFVMPMIGWYLVTRAADAFEDFRPFIPWIALILLIWIGGKMLRDGIEEFRNKKASKAKDDNESGDDSHNREAIQAAGLGVGTLMMQGIATSIDALSVGFTISSYDLLQAACSALIIGLVTFAICFAGLRIGRKLGTVLADRASIIGGIILIAIGLEIWAKGVFF